MSERMSATVEIFDHEIAHAFMNDGELFASVLHSMSENMTPTIIGELGECLTDAGIDVLRRILDATEARS